MRDTNQKQENNAINLDVTRHKWHMERASYFDDCRDRETERQTTHITLMGMYVSVSNILSEDNKRNDGKNDEGCLRAILESFTS